MLSAAACCAKDGVTVASLVVAGLDTLTAGFGTLMVGLGKLIMGLGGGVADTPVVSDKMAATAMTDAVANLAESCEVQGTIFLHLACGPAAIPAQRNLGRTCPVYLHGGHWQIFDSILVLDLTFASRRIVCSRCRTEFTCALSGTCRCSEEPARHPLSLDGEDCLCRECLRKAAAAVGNSGAVSR